MCVEAKKQVYDYVYRGYAVTGTESSPLVPIDFLLNIFSRSIWQLL